MPHYYSMQDTPRPPAPQNAEKSTENPGPEQEGARIFQRVLTRIRKENYRFVRSSSGAPSLAVADALIDLRPSSENIALIRLLVSLGDVTLASLTGRIVSQRLVAYAHAHMYHCQHASLAAWDGTRLLVPIKSGSLLRISSEAVDIVPNGSHARWVTHPRNEPFDLTPSAIVANGKRGLLLFEELIVKQLTCGTGMAWLAALSEAAVPFVRDALPDRPIVVHQGPPGAGKTTGAGLILRLLDLGRVRGDISIAGLSGDDPGIVVIDNVEHRNLTGAMTDYLLLAATGAEKVRATKAGNSFSTNNRPIVALTTVEGITSEDLRRRSIVVEHLAPQLSRPRGDLEGAVLANRNGILCGVFLALQTLIQNGVSRHQWKPTKDAGFHEYFSVLAGLLYACEQLLGRVGWAEALLAEIAETMASRRAEGGEDDTEISILKATGRLPYSLPYKYRDVEGRLFITTYSELLAAMASTRSPEASLPRTPKGLSARLAAARWTDLTVMQPEMAPDVPALKRTSGQRNVGIFVPGGTWQVNVSSTAPSKLCRVLQSDHRYLAADDECYCLWEYADEDTGTIEAIKQMKSYGTDPAAASEAVGRAAQALSQAIPDDWRSFLFVPMPPSMDNKHPRFNRSTLAILEKVEPRLPLIRPLLQQDASLPRGNKTIRPEERARLLSATSPSPEVTTLVLFDDVLTTGSHFSAAVQAIRAVFAGRILGLFLARARNQRAAAASA